MGVVGIAGPWGDSEKWKQRHKKSRKKVEGNTEKTPEEGGDEDEGDEGKLISPRTGISTLPTYFVFTPYHLASLVNPKNLKTLEVIGEMGNSLSACLCQFHQ